MAVPVRPSDPPRPLPVTPVGLLLTHPTPTSKYPLSRRDVTRDGKRCEFRVLPVEEEGRRGGGGG